MLVRSEKQINKELREFSRLLEANEREWNEWLEEKKRTGIARDPEDEKVMADAWEFNEWLEWKKRREKAPVTEYREPEVVCAMGDKREFNSDYCHGDCRHCRKNTGNLQHIRSCYHAWEDTVYCTQSPIIAQVLDAVVGIGLMLWFLSLFTN